MGLSTHKRNTAFAICMASAVALIGVVAVRAEDDGAPPAHGRAGSFWPMQAPSLLAEESGVPPRGIRLRAIVARAWDDSIATWKRIMEGRAAEVEGISLQFVAKLKPNNCYGLYAGQGPAYCSGNRTVFVSTSEAKRLMARFGPHGEAGITFLIGHEFGHHIQNMDGRFLLLGRLLARTPPEHRADLVRRFELEADCFAGVWMHTSEAWAQSARFRAQVLAVLRSIGDDTVISERPLPNVIAGGAHGSSEQRTRWFLRGAETGNIRACNTFRAAQP